jgi:hypothetical protein
MVDSGLHAHRTSQPKQSPLENWFELGSPNGPPSASTAIWLQTSFKNQVFRTEASPVRNPSPCVAVLATRIRRWRHVFVFLAMCVALHSLRTYDVLVLPWMATATSMSCQSQRRLASESSPCILWTWYVRAYCAPATLIRDPGPPFCNRPEPSPTGRDVDVPAQKHPHRELLCDCGLRVIAVSVLPTGHFGRSVSSGHVRCISYSVFERG